MLSAHFKIIFLTPSMLKGFTIQYKPENCVRIVVFGLSFNKETSHGIYNVITDNI